jgi:ATP-dependent 26S proteasome regulatory subunit
MKGFKAFTRYVFSKPVLLSRALLVGALFSSPILDELRANLSDFKDVNNLRIHMDSEVSNLQSKYSKHAAYFPPIVIKQKGNFLITEFQIDQRKCDIFSLIVELFGIMESPDFRFRGQSIDNESELYRKFGSNPTSPIRLQGNQILKTFKHGNVQTFQMNFEERINGIWTQGTFSISGEVKLDSPAFRLILEKEASMSSNLTSLFLRMYEIAQKPSEMSEVRKAYIDSLRKSDEPDKNKGGFFFSGTYSPSDTDKILKEFKDMGLEVIMPDAKGSLSGKSWSELGGYEKQKRDIEDTILLALTHADVYDKISEATRVKFEKSRPKAVLFEGPPGTGKTTSAKIIASTVGIPLIYVPAEAMLSKWYGDSEKSLASIFEKAAELGKVILFIDEIDSLAGSRDSDGMHEVSKRMVSTLLRKLDSFESNNDVLLICATNRKDRLDPAMLSRVDLSITFDLPDVFARKEIFKRYAKHLKEEELEVIAQNSEGLSGRSILETCKNVERKWASMIIRKEVEGYVPSAEMYQKALKLRIESHLM